MVVGILLAGGVGQRMGASIPKQFIEVNGKPIILYPLEIMNNHPLIDAIEIVCVKDFIPVIQSIVKKEGINKVKWITEGGATCQDSTKNGLVNLKNSLNDNDIVMIHMTSYPLANEKIMTACIQSAKEKGNGCTARPVLYSVFETEDQKTSKSFINRNQLKLCTIPYAFRFGECLDLYNRAYLDNKGISGNVFTNTLYCDYGKTIFFTNDSETNMKVTTPEDLLLMKAFLSLKKESDNNE